MKIIKLFAILFLLSTICEPLISQALVPDKERERVANEVMQSIREESFYRLDALVPRYRQTYAQIVPNQMSSLNAKEFKKLVNANYDKFKELFDKLIVEMNQDTIDPKHVEYVRSEVRQVDARKMGTEDKVYILGIFMKQGKKKFSLPLLIGIVDQKIYLMGING